MSDLPATQMPREDEIDKMLSSDWHPIKISRTLASRYGIQVSPEEIAHRKIDLEIVSSKAPLQTLHKSDRIIDAHQDLANLLVAEEERVRILLQEEKESGVVKPGVNVYINQLFRHLHQFAELERDLGISPHQIGATSSDQPRATATVREIIDSMRRGTLTLERITVENG